MYSQLSGPVFLAEAATPYILMTERHLHAMWLEQKYFKDLSVDGRPVNVISPGIWNQNAGPDFLKAHLRIGGNDYFGDIEIHLSREDWYNHRHHEDPRYDDVILHVALWEPDSLRQLTTSQGRPIPQTFLENKLTISQARIVQLIDLDLYPYKQFVGSGRCAQALFTKLPDQQIVSFFHEAARWRLARKKTHLQACADTPQLAFGAGVSMVLGYRHNAKAFLELFNYLYPHRELGEDGLLALALSSCGFFEKKYQEHWKESEYYQHLHALSVMLAFDHIPPKLSPLELHQIRPLNHPVRRLAILSKWLIDPRLDTTLAHLLQLWKSLWKFKRPWLSLHAVMIDALPDYADPHWNSRYTFETAPRPKFLPLLGNQIKNEMILNAALPLMYEDILNRGNGEEVQAFNDFYASLPASHTSKTRYLAHRFFGDTPKKYLINSASIEQGCYQLHRDFCYHYEASCEGCPFIERFKLNQGS